MYFLFENKVIIANKSKDTLKLPKFFIRDKHKLR